MKNITKLYITENGTPLYTHYNGSWNIMKMKTTDGADYSYPIDDMISESLYYYQEENEVELEGDDYTNFVKTELEYFADCYGIELLEASWFDKKEAAFNYLQECMLNTTCVCDYIFEGADKPHFTTIWKEVSEDKNDYTMEDIRNIVMGYKNQEQFSFTMLLDKRFYDKVEKMKAHFESNSTKDLWSILEEL